MRPPRFDETGTDRGRAGVVGPSAGVRARRGFLSAAIAAVGGSLIAAETKGPGNGPAGEKSADGRAAGKESRRNGGPAGPIFRISLAEWSLHRTLFAGKLDHVDFPRIARQRFGIEAVEYVNQFFKDKAKDPAYLADLAKRADDEGVKGLLVMCDGLGRLGDPDGQARTKSIENHFPWVEAAKRLGCQSIRVNASSDGSFEEQQKLAADGLARLCEYADQMKMSVIVENHGGLSSNGEWLAGVMKRVDRPNCGTLPDFGNFHGYDRYRGVEELMPWAKGVSAKSHEFGEDGNETSTDYRKMLAIVREAGYRGHVGIEYEGKTLPEDEGILATKKLLERILAEWSA